MVGVELQGPGQVARRRWDQLRNRVAVWLLGVIVKLLTRQRPGPQAPEGSPPPGTSREAAVKKLTDLYAWLRGTCAETESNRCYSPEAKQRIAQMSEIQTSGVLSFAEITTILEMDERQLRRIRKEVEAAGGAVQAAR